MKIIATKSIVLSHEDVAILSRAKDILIEKIIVNHRDSDACGLACAITDCLDVLNDLYIEEDY
jgi:hypothetical protein